MSAKPRVLVLGGVGFVGRTLVKKLVDEDSCSFIRVCDKSIPIISYCSDEHKAALDAAPLVEFSQCDLVQDAHLARAFDVGEGGAPFDIVVNLAAETRFGMDEEVYKSKCLDLSVKCGQAAKKMGVKCFVEVSHGQVYKSSKVPCNEDAPIKPWTKHAKYKHQAEEALRAIDGLPLVVLRLATVYGNGDVSGLMPRVVIAAAYKQLGETMKVSLSCSRHSAGLCCCSHAFFPTSCTPHAKFPSSLLCLHTMARRTVFVGEIAQAQHSSRPGRLQRDLACRQRRLSGWPHI